MDVLQIIKDDHARIQSTADELQRASSMTARKKLFKPLQRDLLQHLHIEAEFLYPEAEDCVVNIPESFFNISAKNHKVLLKGLKKVEKVVEKRSLVAADQKAIEALSQAIENHFSLEESVLMPRMRKLLPTQEREDLGLVYRDYAQEVIGVTRQKTKRSTRKAAL